MAKKRPDGRKPLLVYMSPELIQDLKLRAVREETHVYLLVEQALLDAKARQEG
jgi:hypothetical protein